MCVCMCVFVCMCVWLCVLNTANLHACVTETVCVRGKGSDPSATEDTGVSEMQRERGRKEQRSGWGGRNWPLTPLVVRAGLHPGGLSRRLSVTRAP